jgi:hypothetical protein
MSAAIATLHLQTLSSPTETPCPLNDKLLISPSVQSLVITLLLSVSVNLTTLVTSYKGSHMNFVFFVTGLFHFE